MLTHDQIWTALDRLAERAGLSASGLARSAGLDPTTFNKSKRITPDGRERWPSTESVAKALAATGATVDIFVQLIEDTARAAQAVPLLGFAEAGTGGYFAPWKPPWWTSTTIASMPRWRSFGTSATKMRAAVKASPSAA